MSAKTPFRICDKQKHAVIKGQKYDVYDANNELVAVQVDLATAQLVEAAPRMREALESIVNRCGNDPGGPYGLIANLATKALTRKDTP